MALRLTDKQKKFINEYLIDLNATQAAIRAGYSKKNAFKIGSELLQKTTVRAQLQKKQAQREQRTEITQDKVLKELANIAFANGTDYTKVVKQNNELLVGIVPTEDLTEEQKSAVAGIKQTQTGIEIKLNDKLKALELIGKHLGMFDEKPDSVDDIEDITPLAEMLRDNNDKNTDN